jgi:tetratricopeptide (TPR) repeat protein
MLLNVKGLSTSEIEKTHAVIGDCYQALKNYKKAVAHYEHAINSDTYIVLNKLATSARLGKDFNRAMQAYADLVPMIDKVEAEDDYKRVTRLLVAMTQATRKMMQAPSTAEVFRSEGDKALGTLSLDDDI